MAIGYISTSNILVFPATRRSTVQQSSRYQLETTFSGIFEKTADYADGCFILTKPHEDLDKKILYFVGKEAFEFMIKGYWFRIAHLDDIFNINNGALFKSATKIYAYIELDKYAITLDSDDDNRSEYKYELKGRDDTNIYNGLKFTDTLPVGANIYSLLLFERDNTSVDWSKTYTNGISIIVPESLYKYDFNAVELTIDGGIIS